jgi:hypothetical protein
MIKGQCLCGAVQYQYYGEIENSILSYCSDCQQAQGSIAGWTAHLTKHNLKFCQDMISSKNISTHQKTTFQHTTRPKSAHPPPYIKEHPRQRPPSTP